MQLRTIHRTLALLVGVFTLYLSTTGSIIEAIDMRSIITDPSPFDPNLMAMREDFAGPGNFRVLATSDHVAAPIPKSVDLGAMFATVMRGTRAALGSTDLKYVELRMQEGHPVGIVRTAAGQTSFDAVTGASLGTPAAMMNEDRPPASLRNVVKHLHRMTTFGNWALWINIVVAASLVTLIVTGCWMYAKMLMARVRMGRTQPFWSAGGWWRALHRSISVVTAIFLTITTLSGMWLAVESLCFGLYLSSHVVVLASGRVVPQAFMVDAAAPLPDAQLQPMLATTMAAYHAAMPGVLPRVVRLRYYGGMAQGVVISDGPVARQLVFNAATGRRVGLTEPGYPATGFPFGWQAHQIAKSIHRGSYFGLSGRAMSITAGLSMIYLSVSGLVLYWQMWKRRRRGGKKRLIWS